MHELTKKIIEILAEYKNGLTRNEIITILEKRTGKRYARSTVFDNIPQEIIRKISIYNVLGRPSVKFRLMVGYEAYISEENN